MRRRRSIAALITLAAGAAAALPLAAVAGPGAVAVPDLRADKPEDVGAPEFYSVDGVGAGRLLVRFDGYVTNVGNGPLEVAGNPSAGTMRQLARVGPDGSTARQAVGSPPVQFETADGHNHWHLMRAMRYSLWNAERTALVAPAQKVGFCLYDSETASGAPVRDRQEYPLGDPDDNFCQQGEPGAQSLRMGVSAGWRDLYDRNLALQWVDVSDTAPGRYSVAAEADPDGLIWEGGDAREQNRPAFADEGVTVPGWLAQSLTTTQTGGAQSLRLAAAEVGTLSDSRLRFRIVTPPRNGTLSVTPGQDFASPTVTYTPSPGFRGADSFTYVARDADSRFPLNPPAATVSIGDASVTVALNGAPQSVTAGTSVQLNASVVNGSGGVRWTVDGVPGGNAAVGTITPTGLYSAPLTPPPSGGVTVRATSVDQPSSFAETRIAIAPAPPVQPAPLPVTGSEAETGAGGLLAGLRVGRTPGRAVVARVTPRASGRLAVTIYHRTAVAGRCVARVPAGRAFTCRVRLRPSMRSRDIRAIAVLRTTGGERASARASLVRPSRRGAITAPRVTRSRSGRTVVVRLAARRAGTLSVAARHEGRRADACVRRLTRPGAVVCRLQLGRRLADERVRVVVQLKARGGARTTRAVTVRA